MQTPELTLIVAATRNMGIGAGGTLPWKGLRKEMQFFARVTTRLPPQAPSGAINAVIMGRKTWDSIPPKFRPLKDRLNIVITRSATAPPPPPPSHGGGGGGGAHEPVRLSSVDGALRYAQEHCGGRVFVMGGAQIYAAALRLPQARRVLLTSIDAEYDCDTFFPIRLGTDEGTEPGWERRSDREWKAWTGEEDAEDGWREEAGVKYEFQMWEKEADAAGLESGN